MRRELALLITMAGMLGWCAAPASADPNILAKWTLDEGAGQVAADSSGHANTGVLGASTDPDVADPGWIPGHAGGGALVFDGTNYVTITNTGLLESPQARGRRVGAPLGLAGALALRAVQRLAAVQPQRVRPVLGLERGHGLLRLERDGVRDLARGLAGHRVGRRMAPHHRLLRRRSGAAVDRRLAGRRRHAGHGADRLQRQRRHLHRHLPRLVRPRLQRRDRRRHGVGRPARRGDDRSA